MTDSMIDPLLPERHTATKRQLLKWLENVDLDDPITVYSRGWWFNLVGVDANPDNMTVILETRDDFDITNIHWEGGEQHG
jgi:hypothetical protein